MRPASLPRRPICWRHVDPDLIPWLVANAGAAVLYLPWLPIAWRQATQPPVPPWRAATALGPVLRESWTALVAGQSAPAWLWPAVLLLLPVYLLGLVALARADAGPSDATLGVPRGIGLRLLAALASPAALLALATFGALALVLLVSAATPLYHVRYVVTYSPAFYIVLAAGLAWLWPRWRPAAPGIAALWLAAAALSLQAFWFDPAFRPDDHRAAVAYLESRLRPGDAVLVNAGYAYTALATYWQGPIDSRGRLTGDLPYPAKDNGLVLLTTGHVDGKPGLGWGDPRSDFFPLPAGTARAQLETLFSRFSRVWHYRIYDTVNDPQGLVRGLLAGAGHLSEERTFPGEAFLRVQSFASRSAAAPDAAWPAATAGGLELRAAPLPGQAESGQTIYPALWWWPQQPVSGTLATSLRLVDANGTIWAQPPDEQPLGPAFTSSQWPAGHWQRQAAALPISPGTPPGRYQVELVPYDAASGQTWPLKFAPGGLAASPNGISLGQVTVVRPQPEPALQPAQAHFGPLALLQATSPAAAVKPGESVPVELLWQAQTAPGEALVVVLQLLDGQGKVVAGMEAQPLDGRYPAQAWEAGEMVRDRHSLALPKDLAPGAYRLIVGLYQAADGRRLSTPRGPLAHRDSYPIKTITIQP